MPTNPARMLALTLMAAAVILPAAAQPRSADVLILIDDERLAGHLVSAGGSSLTFKSDLLGNLTTDWKNVREMRTQGQYAVVAKGVEVRPGAASAVPQGRLEVAGQTITITSAGGGPPRSLPVAEAALVIEEADFQKQVNPPSISFVQAWTGTITAGATIVQATQQSRTFTGVVNLVRAIPPESNFRARNRTILTFAAAEGTQQQPHTPKIKTEIVHADAERDQYFPHSLVFGFAQAAFDHNYSQGLTLQQQYAGGIGWTAIKRADETLDLKASIGFIRQQFQVESQNKNLIASSFSENFLRRFGRGMVFTEQLIFTPAWNDLNAWLALGSASLNIPVYKRLSFNISTLDSYLHDPAPGFHRNSFQATTGLTYSLR